MLLSPTAIGAVTEILDASDFYRGSHGTIYRACSRSAARASRSTRSRSRTSSRSAASSSRSAAARGSPSSRRSSRRPRTSSTTRRSSRRWRRCAASIQAGQEIARLGQERPGETTDLVDRAEQIVFDLAQQRVTGDFAHIGPLLNESFERITQLYEAGADVTGIPCGFRELDKLTSGFQPGNLIILAARPSMGKSALALCIAANLGVRHETPGRAVHARDVEGRGDAAPDVQRGEGRVATASAPGSSPRTTGRGSRPPATS